MKGLSVKKDGTIFEKKTGRVIPVRGDGRGYLCFTYKGRTYKAHSAVCTMKHGPRPPGHIAGHKNHNKLDHRPCNVAWMTRGENVRQAHGVKAMKKNYARRVLATWPGDKKFSIGFNSVNEAAKCFELSPGTIASAASNKSRTAGGMRWAYV